MGVARVMAFNKTFVTLMVCTGLSSFAASAEETTAEELTEITVTAARVANTRPAGTYASVATQLRFDPLTELQSRGLPEGQADVTVRGGLFENTGFKAGAVIIMDPQTGHYAAELPLDPDFLTAPELLLGIDNTIAGFNSNIATVGYAFRNIVDGGSVLLGVGSDDLQYQSLRYSNSIASEAGPDLGFSVSAARSEGDGTLPNGDHEFERYNLHLQRSGPQQQSDFVIGYQDKFFGWPGAYTGFATLPETDHTKTTLLLANHRNETDSGHWELGAFFRRLEDDYDFDRRTQESGEAGSFDHETRVYGVGFGGVHRGSKLLWHYSGQLVADDLVASTDLTEGDFSSRNYGSVSLVPSIDVLQDGDRLVTVRFGASVDWSSRDNSEVSPVFGATMRKTMSDGSRFVSFEYAGASQLPGYTALKSQPTGLFGGNADLGREKARQASIAVGKETVSWNATATVFYREDDDLVDWTYASGAPFARQANSVDVEVLGLELFARKHWSSFDLVGGYTYLDKDADYGSAVVDASFYALNYATHRATLAAHYRFSDRLELRWDNEYRKQRRNPLRSSSDDALLVSVALEWVPANGSGFGAALTADNLTDDEYEQFPGTPAVGRQLSLNVRYLW
jgi:vitamin B12 transporter